MLQHLLSYKVRVFKVSHSIRCWYCQWQPCTTVPYNHKQRRAIAKLADRPSRSDTHLPQERADQSISLTCSLVQMAKLLLLLLALTVAATNTEARTGHSFPPLPWIKACCLQHACTSLQQCYAHIICSCVLLCHGQGWEIKQSVGRLLSRQILLAGPMRGRALLSVSLPLVGYQQGIRLTVSPPLNMQLPALIQPNAGMHGCSAVDGRRAAIHCHFILQLL